MPIAHFVVSFLSFDDQVCLTLCLLLRISESIVITLIYKGFLEVVGQEETQVVAVQIQTFLAV